MNHRVWSVSLLVGSASLALVLAARAVVSADPQVASGPADATSAEPTAESLLKNHRLSRVARFWLFPEEIALRDQLAALEKMERRLGELRQAVDQAIEVNESCRQKLNQAESEEKRLRGLLPVAKAGSPQRKQLDLDLKAVGTLANQLRQAYQPPDRLGVGFPLRPLCLELVNLRTEMAIRLLPLRPTLDKLLSRYDLLREDAGVMAAIAAAGASDQLGPLPATRDATKTLDRLHAEVFPDWLPVYRDGSLYRVTALVNDRDPLTFSFGDTGQRTVITDNQAATAGLKFDEKIPAVRIRVAPGRDELVRLVKIPRLRFGRVILSNVEAAVLPPEAADLGARIGPGAFEGHRVHLDAEHFSLYIPGS